MKNYDVTLPITGTVVLTVEADSPEDAIERALVSDELVIDNIEIWEAHEIVVQGNVYHGDLNEAEAELAFGEDEDE